MFQNHLWVKKISKGNVRGDINKDSTGILKIIKDLKIFMGINSTT